MQHLTDRFVKSLELPKARDQEITYDDELKGFGIRITKNGSKSFVLNYHVEGRERRITIGPFPAWSVAAARVKAAEFRRASDAGDDPLHKRKLAQSELAVSDIWKRYETEVLVKKAKDGQIDEKAMWDKWINPHLGHLKLSHVSYSDVERLHRKISETTPVRANRIVSVLRHLFNIANRWRACSTNPAIGIKPNPEQARDRYLKPEETEKVLFHLSRHPQRASADAILFMLLTGCRRGEALSASWDQIQLDKGKETWRKPSSHTKQRKIHTVPLSQAALAVLRKRRAKTNGDFVFPGTDGKPLTDVKRTWRKIRDNAGCPDVRLHDLRHTFASTLISGGASLSLVGAMLGHTQAQTTLRYAHLFDDPMREAANAAAEKLGVDSLKVETA